MTVPEDTGTDAASREVATTYLDQVVRVDKNALRDINEIARYLFSSQIKCVSAKALIALGLANASNVDVLVNALLQRKYITVSTKEGFYNIVPQGLVPSKLQRKSKPLTMEEKMERLHEPSNRDEFLHFARHSWLDVAWSLSRQGFNIFDRFPGTALVAPDRYPLPVTASKVLEILIDDGIIFAHSESYFRFTDKAKKILDTKKGDSILPPADATPGGVSRSIGDKKHLKTLRRDLREIAVALNTWEFKRDDNRLAAVLVKLMRNSQLEIVKSVDGIFAACEELVASNNFVFRKGDGFVIKQDDEELRVRMLAANAVTHSPTQRPSAPTAAQAPVARPPSRDERRGGRTFLPFPPRVPDPVKLPPKPQPVAHSAAAAPVPAKIVAPVVATTPVPVLAPVVQQNVAPPAVPEVTVEEVHTPTPPPTSVAAVDVIPAPVPILPTLPVVEPVLIPQPPSSVEAVKPFAPITMPTVVAKPVEVGSVVPVIVAALVAPKPAEDEENIRPISLSEAQQIAQPIDKDWALHVRKHFDSRVYMQVDLAFFLTSGLPYTSSVLLTVLVEDFGFDKNSAYQVMYQCRTKGMVLSISTSGGKVFLWQKNNTNHLVSFLSELQGKFVKVAKALDVKASAVSQPTPIDQAFVAFVVAKYTYTEWSNVDFVYVVTQGHTFISINLIEVLTALIEVDGVWISSFIYYYKKIGFLTAERIGLDKKIGSVINWLDTKVGVDTKKLLAQVQEGYAKHCKTEMTVVLPQESSVATVPVPASHVSLELVDHVLEQNAHMNTKEDLEKALAEAERLNKLLDEATGFFVAEQATHRETAKQLRDEQAAHQATSAKLAKLKDALNVISDFLKTE